MLKIEKINKSYKTGDFVQNALKDVSLEFRENEFVAVLGPSGSGKTTLLNIVGGLDRYDSGDLIINGKSTKQFKDKEWDAYRNNCVGFVFQSYNLIGHISVLSNVELGMTLSGISSKKRRKKALQVLDKVGLKEHAHKKPNQLSGGQMQRVAIARALANNPDIILADEPTGALDSTTSVQIMDLIKEIAKDKLVIMVTHNPDLANAYANRVVEFKDGELVNDSNPIKKTETKEGFKIKKTAMSFLTALNLSFNNIKTKKGRTLLTAFASSIGIIGIALILSLSNGFKLQIDKFEKDTLINMPIAITNQAVAIDREKVQNREKKKEYNEKYIYPEETMLDMVMHKNVITTDYIKYLEKIDKKIAGEISYTYAADINFLVKNKDKVTPYKRYLNEGMSSSMNIPDIVFMEYSGLWNMYSLFYGKDPKSKTEIALMVDGNNRINKKTLEALGLDSKETYKLDELIGLKIKVATNEDMYKKIGDNFIPNIDFNSIYKSKNTLELEIVGILKPNEEISNFTNSSDSGIIYTDSLTEYVLNKNKSSEIVKIQKKVNHNILTQAKFNTKEDKENFIKYLGGDSVPVAISIYPNSFDKKDSLLKELDNYNKGLKEEEKIVYTDYADMISSMSANIMDAITIVLVAFSAISLVVSSIMIGIITYISVLERTKEIGILRALGARKKDISRVFNAETFIIGLTSGALGIAIAFLLTFPANAIIYNLTNLKSVARLNPIHALFLIIISLILTLIGGFIPAKMASKKDPVEALRTE